MALVIFIRRSLATTLTRRGGRGDLAHVYRGCINYPGGDVRRDWNKNSRLDNHRLQREQK